MVRGSHQFGFGGTRRADRLEDAQSNVALGGPFIVQRRRDRIWRWRTSWLGNVFEFRQATPFVQDATQRNFGALRPGHVAGLDKSR